MGVLAWSMMAIALWHFTVFLPDRYLGGIVGAFVFALVGGVLGGLIVNGFSVPGNDDTTILLALQAVPGTLVALAICWVLGDRRERAAEAAEGLEPA